MPSQRSRVLAAADVWLALAGTGPLMEETRRLAGRLGVADRVRFLGVRRDIPGPGASLCGRVAAVPAGRAAAERHGVDEPGRAGHWQPDPGDRRPAGRRLRPAGAHGRHGRARRGADAGARPPTSRAMPDDARARIAADLARSCGCIEARTTRPWAGPRRRAWHELPDIAPERPRGARPGGDAGSSVCQRRDDDWNAPYVTRASSRTYSSTSRPTSRRSSRRCARTRPR